jgi:hypothetical protein
MDKCIGLIFVLKVEKLLTMKRNRIVNLIIASAALTAVSCNNNGNGTGSTDSTNTTNTATTTQTSTNNYAARADSFRVNSEGGNYLNPRTGKPYKLSMNTQTGAVSDESGHPVKRYVDKRTWWIYDAASGDTVGSARMNNGNLMYRGTNGDWVPYEKRWTDDMDSSSMNTNNSSVTTSDSSNSSSGTSETSGTTGTHGKTKVKVKSNGSAKVKTDH